MKKSIHNYILTFLGIFLLASLLVLIGSDWDWDFYVEELYFTITATVLAFVVLCFKGFFKESKKNTEYQTASSSSTDSEERIMDKKWFFKDFDIKEVNFNIPDYDESWFDFDVFHNDLYNVIIDFHSENFKDSKLPAILKATKEIGQSYNDDNKYLIEIDHRCDKDYYFANNKEFDSFLLETHILNPVYMCTYDAKDTKTLMKAFNEISSLSESTEIEKLIYTKKENFDDFFSKVLSMNKIPEEIKKYFSEQFKNDFLSIKYKEYESTESSVTYFRSGLVLKNGETCILDLSIKSINDTLYLYISL